MWICWSGTNSRDEVVWHIGFLEKQNGETFYRSIFVAEDKYEAQEHVSWLNGGSPPSGLRPPF